MLSDEQIREKLREAVTQIKQGDGLLRCGRESELAPLASRAAHLMRDFDEHSMSRISEALLRTDPELTPVILDGLANLNTSYLPTFPVDAAVAEHLKQALGHVDHRVSNIAGMLLHCAAPSQTVEDRCELIRYLDKTAPYPWPSPAPPLRGEPGNLRLFCFPTGPGVAMGPYLDAPRTESQGGKLYLDAALDRVGLTTAINMLGIRDAGEKVYAFFTEISEEPVKDQYLVQCRIVTNWMLDNLFLARPLPDSSLLNHHRTIEELFWAFMGHQKAVFGSFFADERSPAGAFGGDGEYAREELSFGLMTELPGVYRIWSRAWLVEK